MSGPSVLDYARYYGLAIDAKSQNLLGLIDCSPIQDKDCGNLLRGLSCPEYEELLRDDKLQASHNAITTLKGCMKSPPTPDWAFVLADSQRARKLKVEMPMLVSDHIKDMKWFRKGLDLQKLLRNCKEAFKVEGPEIDGLPDIFEECERQADSINAELEHEGLESTTEVLKILAACTSDAWKEQDMDDIIEQDLKPTKPSAMRPLTPLLTPQAFPEESDIPRLAPLPQLDLEPRSECSLEADNLLMQVERVSKVEDQVCTSDVEARSSTTVRAMLREASLPASIDPVHILSLHQTAFEPTPEADQCFTPNDLKVEIPMVLSPPQSEQKPKCGKRVAFKDMFEEIINFSPQDEIKADTTLKEEDLDQTALLQRLEQYETDVKDEIMSAKPGINDKALRVQVPTLERIEVVDPRARTASASMVRQVVRGVGIIGIETQPAAETKLNWIPIPQKLTQIDLSERVEEGVPVRQLVETPDKILRSEQLLCTEPGLRVLDADDDDCDVMEEESELALALIADMPMKIVPQKRPAVNSLGQGSQEHEMTTAQLCGGTPASAAIDARHHNDRVALARAVKSHDVPAQRFPSPSTAQRHQPQRSQITQTDDLPEPTTRAKKMRFARMSPLWDREIPPDSFTAGGSLTSFLDLRGGKFKKPRSFGVDSEKKTNPLSVSKEIVTDPILVSRRPSPPVVDKCQPLTRSGSLRQPHEHVEVPSTPNGEVTINSSLPLPASVPLDGHRTIIVDSALVNNRQLFSFVEKHAGDSLNIIYRDLGGTPDIMLNPKTCIVFTNFQALTQRSLPGQTPKQSTNSPQQLIKQLTLEFEILFILISVSANLNTQGLDGQMTTMADFSSFCASLQSDFPSMQTVPLWIPVEESPSHFAGHSSSLCRWTWSLVCRHAFKNTSEPTGLGEEEHIGIIQEETLWEVFLRKAGVNAMAAQVILGEIKRPEQPDQDVPDVEVTATSGRTWGLRRFVSMPPEERLRRFSRLVGRTAVERINKTLD